MTTIDDTLFSVDFRRDVEGGVAVRAMIGLGLTVVRNLYADYDAEYRELLVKSEGNPFEIGRRIAQLPEVEGIYSTATGHVTVLKPELSYQEMTEIAAVAK